MSGDEHADAAADLTAGEDEHTAGVTDRTTDGRERSVGVAPAPSVEDDDAIADRWTDPYRWACPRGHVFHRTFDPRGPVECYSCERTYDAADLIDRKRERAPPWHTRQGPE